LIGLFIWLLFQLATQAQTLPPHSPTPEQEALIEGNIPFDPVIYDSLPEEVQLIVPMNLPAFPTEVSTNPTPPKMDIAIYEALPSYIKDEVEANVRAEVDQETRPVVKLKWRLSLTNEWEVIGVWKPYELTGFYKVVVE